MPGEGSGAAIPDGARPGAVAGGGAAGAGGVGGAGGGGGAKPVPGARRASRRRTRRASSGARPRSRRCGRRLQDRRLLAVIGPSGAGKTSFVRAGVVAARPEGWAASCATPGQPRRSAAWAGRSAPSWRATPRRSASCAAFEDARRRRSSSCRRWRRRHGEALAGRGPVRGAVHAQPPEVQERFAALLGRLACEADVHVLLSLRDDFLMRCTEHEAAAPGLRVAHAAPAADAARGCGGRWSSRRGGAATASRTRRSSEEMVGVGRGGAGGAAAPGLRRLAPLGEAGPREEAPDAGGVRGDRRRRGGARPARRGHDGPDRRPSGRGSCARSSGTW